MLHLKPFLKEDLEASIHHLRIIEDTPISLNLLESFVYAVSRSIRPVRRRSLDNVSYS